MGAQTKKEAISAMLTMPRGRNRGPEANIRRKGQVPTVAELQKAIQPFKPGPVNLCMARSSREWTVCGDHVILFRKDHFVVSLPSFSCSTRAAKELLVQLRAAIAAEVSDE